VRDCSCRGDDAGFAHISCIVDYARRKSIEADDWLEFGKPWIVCEHCKQKHENQLRIDLLDEFKRFVDERSPGCNWRHLAVQNQWLMAVLARVELVKEKRAEIIDTTLSIIDQLSINPEASMHPHTFAHLKAAALNTICQIRLTQACLTEDEAMKCLGYLEERRKTKESLGEKLEVAELEVEIASFKTRCIERFGAHEAFGALETKTEMIEKSRKAYQLLLENYGEAVHIKVGPEIAYILSKSQHTIEAWRLLKRLVAISQQHHGREHRNTIEIERMLANLKVQCVTLRSLGFPFRAIGYEDNKYVLQGPIGVPEERMQTLRVDPADVILKSNGVPVVCHGLKNNAAYLNGKIGDIRSFDVTTGRYGVYFEDESIKLPKSVKPWNLRILFELPDY
jgi:hypothetical protein